MRVAIHAPSLTPDVGGGYTYERDVIEALATARHETKHELIAVGPAPRPPHGWKESEYLSLDLDVARKVVGRVRRTIQAATPPGRRTIRRRADEEFQRRGIDIVWCVAAGSPTRELPFVTTVLDLQHRRQPIFPEVSAGGEWAARERFYVQELGRAAIVVVGNETGQAEVERLYGIPPERIRKLPHPTPRFALDDTTEANDALERHGLTPGFVFYPAQFWAHKNHVGLLQAIAILSSKHELALDAVFVGSDKGTQAHVRTVANELGLGAQVHFLGFVPRADLVTLYRQAFALAYVSYFGPENLPPLEAFALGCPVVAADVPGAREQLGDAALLASPRVPEEVAAALLRLHREPELRSTLTERGRNRAHSFRPAEYVRGMFAILDELEPTIRTWR
jgi:glycosyltransferase involved in cell wall biosynthesis